MMSEKTAVLTDFRSSLRQKPQLQILLLILALSVSLRLIAALLLGNEVEELPGTADQTSYHTLATRLLAGHGFTFGEAWWPLTAAGAPTAHWSFLYTFYVAGVYALFGENPLVPRLIQALIVGILQPYFAYLIAERIFIKEAQANQASAGHLGEAGQLAPLLAAGITAVYAYFIYYSASLMTEPFYITLILGVIYLALRIASAGDTERGGFCGKRALGLGLALAACVLLRQLFMLFIPFLGFWLLWRGWQNRQLRSVMLTLTVAAIIVIAAILPFTAYNYARFDRLVLLNTNAGYAFFLGNHPIYGTSFVGILPKQMGSYTDLIPPELRHLDEAALDQALLGEAIKIIADDPVRYVLLSISRAREYFKFWPSTESSLASNFFRVISFGLFLPFMLYGLWRSAVHYRSSPSIWLLYLFITFYAGVHLLSWSLIRYRLPVDAILVIFAGFGIIDLVLRLGISRRSGYFLHGGQIRDNRA